MAKRKFVPRKLGNSFQYSSITTPELTHGSAEFFAAEVIVYRMAIIDGYDLPPYFWRKATDCPAKYKEQYPKAIEWIDKVENWILSYRNKDLLNRLFSLPNVFPKKIFIFVICRHNTFFTGHDVDQRAAWSSLWNMIKTLHSTIPRSSSNRLERLYNELKKVEKDTVMKEGPGTEEDEFGISQYKIVLKSS